MYKRQGRCRRAQKLLALDRVRIGLSFFLVFSNNIDYSTMKSLLFLVFVSVALVGQSQAQGLIAPIRGWLSNVMSNFGRYAGFVSTTTVYDTTTVTTTVTVTVASSLLNDVAVTEEITSSDDLLLDTTTESEASTELTSSIATSAAPLLNTTTFATIIPKTTTVKSTSTTKATTSSVKATTKATTSKSTVAKTTSSVAKTTAPKTTKSPSLILAVRQGSRFFASLRKPKDDEFDDMADVEESVIALYPSKVLK